MLFVDDVDALNLEVLGPRFEHHPLFPERINTEFVKVLDRGRLRMRVWERGAGETMACGTGRVRVSGGSLCQRAERLQGGASAKRRLLVH